MVALGSKAKLDSIQVHATANQDAQENIKVCQDMVLKHLKRSMEITLRNHARHMA